MRRLTDGKELIGKTVASLINLDNEYGPFVHGIVFTDGTVFVTHASEQETSLYDSLEEYKPRDNC